MKKAPAVPIEREINILLAARRERSGREIGDLLGERNWSTLYLAIDRMERRGWVRVRRESEDDRRVRWVRTTAKGERALESASDYYGELAKRAADSLAFEGGV